MRKMLLGAATAVAALTAAGQAQAVTFVLTDTGGTAVGTEARRGFDLATAYWSSVLTDNITVRLNIGFKALGDRILGQTGSTRAGYFTDSVYAYLGADATSALDASAVGTLTPLGASTAYAGRGAVAATVNAFNAAGNGYIDSATRLDNDGSVNNTALAVNTANAKALGLRADNAAVSDGTVIFSNRFGFDFNASDGVDANKYDFVGVAIHEIGHALGFVSGVDSYDFYTSPGDSDPIVRDANGNPVATALEGYAVSSVLDLFRYSAPGKLDWSTQNTPYFSTDGGLTQQYGNSLVSTGTENGDGNQASHWKDSPAGVPQLGVMDPTSGNGQRQEITALDLAAFDAIGYNLAAGVRDNANYRINTAQIYNQFSIPAPEPATWAMMIVGFGVVGGSVRQQRRRAKVSFA